MYRRVTTLVIGVAFLMSGLTATGCSKKLDCKAFAEKVKKCKKGFAKAAVDEAMKQKKDTLAKLTDEQRKMVRKQAEEAAESSAGMMVSSLSSDQFIKECKKNASSDEAQALRKCMAKSSCDEFAACVVAAAKKH